MVRKHLRSRMENESSLRRGQSNAVMDGSYRLGRRGFISAAAATAAGLVVGGCGSGRGSTPGGEPVQLVYQDWRTEWFPPMVQAMLAEFHAQHPDIRVFYTPDPEDFVERMTKEFRAGAAPDVFQGCCTHFPAWAQEGYALDLEPYVQADLDAATIDDWDPAQYAALFTPEGLQFGLPKYHGALALYYNKDLFDDNEVEYPDGSWDHDDYAQAMRLLTDDRDGDGQIDQWGSAIDVSWDRVQVHVNAWGGHFVDPQDPTVSRMGEPEALEALRWLRARIQDDRVLATRLNLQNLSLPDAFVRGECAMIEDGSWSLKTILSGAIFRVGVAPFPRGPARRVTIAATDGFGIYSGTNHLHEAWELMKFLISPEYGRAMAGANLLQPARRSLVDEWISLVREAFPDSARQMDIAAFAEGHNEGYSVTAEIFANMAVAKALAYEAWDEILVLGREPVEAMEAISQEINSAQRGAE